MRELLRPYLAVGAARFQQMLQYRTAAVAGFMTQAWFGAIRVMILAAFYAGGGTPPMSLHNAVAYTWLGQAFLVFLPWAADPDVAEMVRSGSVAYERLRPVDAYAWWYARMLAFSVARVLPRAVLMVVAAGVLLPLVGFGQWGLPPPPDLSAAALFAVAFIGMALLSAAISMLLNVLVVATMNDRGANTLAAPFVNLLSGGMAPLAFFPDWMHLGLRLQPFAGLVDIPFSIYFGGLRGAEAWGGIALQFGWAVILIVLGRLWLEGALRRLQIQGG